MCCFLYGFNEIKGQAFFPGICGDNFVHINKLTNKHKCIWVQFKSSILLCPIIFQIGTITMNKDPYGKPQLLASQPGGTYVTLILKQDAPPDESAPSEARYVQRNSHLYHGSYQWIPKMLYPNKTV